MVSNFIILNTNFIICDTQFINFDTKFVILDTKFVIFDTSARSGFRSSAKKVRVGFALEKSAEGRCFGSFTASQVTKLCPRCDHTQSARYISGHQAVEGIAPLPVQGFRSLPAGPSSCHLPQ